jgi:protein-tyrosine phosphatase
VSEPSSPDGRPFHLLAVCAGNLCRSAAAELLLRRGLASSGVLVASAGVIAPEGVGVHPWTASALARLGVDASGHRAVRLIPEHLAQADLVLAMTLGLRADAVRLLPSSVGRVWTLREFVRYAVAADTVLRTEGQLPGPGDVRLRALRDEARALRGTLPRVAPADDDIADPIEGDEAAHRVAVAEVAMACDQLVRLVTAKPPG